MAVIGILNAINAPIVPPNNNNTKTYIKEVASVCTYRRVDNTMDDKANLKDMDKHRQLY